MIELGRWKKLGLVARWGYDEDYDKEGLIIDNDIYTSDNFHECLCRYGSYGIHELIFKGTAWEQIPELAELSEMYESWGN